jgi:hypothetical protein
MNKIACVGFFFSALLGTSIVAADTINFKGGNGQFHCAASTLPSLTSTGITPSVAPTARIDTSHQNVRGLCQGGNSVNGVTVGAVTSPGHLIQLPAWWIENDGTIIRLQDVCFLTQADRKDVFGGYKEGSVTVASEKGDTSITCFEGCAGTTREFGVGGYC